jgi:hypothetical protein
LALGAASPALASAGADARNVYAASLKQAVHVFFPPSRTPRSAGVARLQAVLTVDRADEQAAALETRVRGVMEAYLELDSAEAMEKRVNPATGDVTYCLSFAVARSKPGLDAGLRERGEVGWQGALG